MIGVTRSGAALPTIMIATINFASTPASNMMRGRETSIETGLLLMFLKLKFFFFTGHESVAKHSHVVLCICFKKKTGFFRGFSRCYWEGS
jgi:hypothetical protein